MWVNPKADNLILRAWMRLQDDEHRDPRAALEDAIMAKGIIGDRSISQGIAVILAYARIRNDQFVEAKEELLAFESLDADSRGLVELILRIAESQLGNTVRPKPILRRQLRPWTQ